MTHISVIRKRIITLLLAFTLTISQAGYLTLAEVCAETYSSGQPQTVSVLAFTSDIHNSEENTAANRLDNWLDKVENKCGDIDVMSFCGDMGSARAQETAFWTYTSRVMDVVENKSISDEQIIELNENKEYIIDDDIVELLEKAEQEINAYKDREISLSAAIEKLELILNEYKKYFINQ